MVTGEGTIGEGIISEGTIGDQGHFLQSAPCQETCDKHDNGAPVM